MDTTRRREKGTAQVRARSSGAAGKSKLVRRAGNKHEIKNKKNKKAEPGKKRKKKRTQTQQECRPVTGGYCAPQSGSPRHAFWVGLGWRGGGFLFLGACKCNTDYFAAASHDSRGSRRRRRMCRRVPTAGRRGEAVLCCAVRCCAVCCARLDHKQKLPNRSAPSCAPRAARGLAPRPSHRVLLVRHRTLARPRAPSTGPVDRSPRRTDAMLFCLRTSLSFATTTTNVSW